MISAFIVIHFNLEAFAWRKEYDERLRRQAANSESQRKSREINPRLH